MNDFQKKFSTAIEFVKNSGMSSSNKPIIPHALRVGELLYEKGFSDDIVNAGLLHDMLEWSGISKKELIEKFGNQVFYLIQANTKDRCIQDKQKRRKAQIDRCLEIGEDALAIKIADTIDSFRYYNKINNEDELKRCREWNVLLLKYMSDSLKGIFEKEIKIINNIFIDYH